MSDDPYDIGQEVTLESTFRIGADPAINELGTLTNPTTVVCKVEHPDGTTETLATTNPSAGLFRAKITPATPGDFWYRFEGTGAAKAAGEGYFSVRQRRVDAA
ncbi:MAG: hypothetical protein M3540_07340 [Actinomycetota bacterium]|nr:hypothetical protein [Actinomycetota bacterium]